MIDELDSDNLNPSETHPKAATRVFQLLGHVGDMWSIGASLNADNLPDAECTQEFAKEVILPAYFDAVEMAKSAEAENLILDLCDPEVFFADIAHAKLGRWGQLQTVGAKEWSELKGANERILPLVYKFQTENKTSI
ncbi:MAG: hypothetical protein JXQ89_04185 [Pelagimonas sp.]